MLIENSWILGSIFIICAALIWIFGIRLTKAIDVIVHHYGWGEAIGGMVFLAIITNLPEIAITAVAAYQKEYVIAVSNILGGIAIQTVVLVLIDVFGVGRKVPLTHKGHSRILQIEGLAVIAVLAIVLVGNSFPSSYRLVGAPAYEWLLLLTWLGSIFWTKHLYNKHLIKKQRKTKADSFKTTTLLDKVIPYNKPDQEKNITAAIAVIVVGSLITLFAGYGLTLSGEILSKRWGMSGVIFGSTILALCTALPEISTGIASAKIRDYEMAVSDIFGGNAFLPVLFFMAALISKESILPNLQFSDIYLSYLGILLTAIYLIGMRFHLRKQYFRMGIDSLAVLIVYILSLIILVFMI
jgi:cation:H+ antiporter